LKDVAGLALEGEARCKVANPARPVGVGGEAVDGQGSHVSTVGPASLGRIGHIA